MDHMPSALSHWPCHPRCSLTTSTISCAQPRISCWSLPSIITRSSGSVPEYRTSSRPWPATRLSTRAIASATAGTRARSTRSRTRTLSSTCGYAVRSAARAVIDEDRAIAVAVERDAHPASMLDDRAREPLRMGRAAAQVDVAAIGLIADHLDVEAEAAEEGRGDRRRGAVRAVDRELEA